MSTKRRTTAKQIIIARDILTRKREKPKKTYFDNFVEISFCALCLTALAAFIQYG